LFLVLFVFSLSPSLSLSRICGECLVVGIKEMYFEMNPQFRDVGDTQLHTNKSSVSNKKRQKNIHLSF
jgi:hypothetical protein